MFKSNVQFSLGRTNLNLGTAKCSNYTIKYISDGILEIVVMRILLHNVQKMKADSRKE
jgi:hypothetical protein